MSGASLENFSRQKYSDIWLTLLVMVGVLLVHMHWIRTDVAVHGGDQVSIRLLARDAFTEKSFRPEIIYYFFDWRDINQPDDNYTPLPVLITGLIYRLFGGNENAALFFNCILWASSIWIWTLLSRRLFQSALPGLLLFVGMSFPFGILSSTTTGMKEHFFGITLMLFLTALVGRKGRPQFFLAGISLGLTYLSRYNILILLQLSPLVTALSMPRFKLQAWMKNTLVLIAGSLIFIVPWWLRNYIDFGNPFKYLVTTYPFSWVPGLMQDFYNDIPPTPANLAKAIGWPQLLTTVLRYQVTNLFIYVQKFSPLFAIWGAGVISMWKTEPETRSKIFLFSVVTLAMIPGALYMPVERYWFCSMLPLSWTCTYLLLSSSRETLSRVFLWCSLFIFLLSPISKMMNSFSPNWIPLLPSPIPWPCFLIVGLVLGSPEILDRYRNLSFLSKHSLHRMLIVFANQVKNFRAAAATCAISIFVLVWSGPFGEALKAAERQMIEPSYVLHRELGARLKTLARPGDVICSHYPAMIYYYTRIPTVSAFYYPEGALGDTWPQATAEEIRKRLLKVKQIYKITLITDLLIPDLEEAAGDLLDLVETVRLDDPTLKPVRIFRIKSSVI
jgi:hypothetical protein